MELEFTFVSSKTSDGKLTLSRIRMHSTNNVIRMQCTLVLRDYHTCAVIGINPKNESRISSNIPSSLFEIYTPAFTHKNFDFPIVKGKFNPSLNTIQLDAFIYKACPSEICFRGFISWIACSFVRKSCNLQIHS